MSLNKFIIKYNKCVCLLVSTQDIPSEVGSVKMYVNKHYIEINTYIKA